MIRTIRSIRHCKPIRLKKTRGLQQNNTFTSWQLDLHSINRAWFVLLQSTRSSLATHFFLLSIFTVFVSFFHFICQWKVGSRHCGWCLWCCWCQTGNTGLMERPYLKFLATSSLEILSLITETITTLTFQLKLITYLMGQTLTLGIQEGAATVLTQLTPLVCSSLSSLIIQNIVCQFSLMENKYVLTRQL